MANEEEEVHKDPPNKEVEIQTQCVWLKNEERDTLWKVYSPVEFWTSIRILLILVAIERWNTMQVDHVQAFPRASIEKDLYLKVPADLQVENGENNDYALKLYRNIYGQKKSERVRSS